MKNIIKYLFVFALISSLIGCVKDRGNYDYDNIPELQMDNFTFELNGSNVTLNSADALVIEQGDLLRITNKEEAKFEAAYSWKFFEKSPNADVDGNYPVAVELSTERDFNINLKYAPGKYILAYEITNKGNDSKFAIIFNIEVESVSGIFVLHAVNGSGDYSAIRTPEVFPSLPTNKFGVNYSIFSGSNAGAKLNNPTNIFFRTLVHTKVTRCIFVAEQGNMTTVDYSSLKTISRNYESQFVFKPDGIFSAQAHVNGVNNKEILIVGGKIHTIDYMSGAGPFGPSSGTYAKNYAPFVLAIPTIRAHVLYNMTDSKFQLMDQFVVIKEFINEGGEVNILDTKMDVIYFDKGNGDVIDAVMKDNLGGIFYVKFNITASNGLCKSKFSISSLPGMSVNSKWAIASRGDASFYTSNNELYVYNNSNGTATAANIGLSASQKIVTIKVLKDAVNTTYDNALILLGVNEGTEGKVYQYAFNPLSGVVDLTSKKVFTGFESIIEIGIKK